MSLAPNLQHVTLNRYNEFIKIFWLKCHFLKLNLKTKIKNKICNLGDAFGLH
jgi:hypothetical protein